MAKSNTFENDLLKLIYNGTPIANLADNAATGALANLFFALHTADPGEAGDQTNSECAYVDYDRVSVARTTGGFTVTDNSVSPVAEVTFPQAGVGTTPEVATHFSVGVAASGASKIIHRGPITTPAAGINISEAVTPELGTGTAITES